MKKYLSLLGLLVLGFLPYVTSAHSFGKLYNLPVPFWMYLYGGIGAMLVSFLVIGYFFNKKIEEVSYPTIDLSKSNLSSFISKGWFLTGLKAVSMFLFLLTIISGFIGENSSYSNFNMTFFWIIFVLGFTYLVALVGNVFAFVNPWKTLTNWFVGKDSKPIFEYSKSFGYYPALVFYFIFIWFELVGDTNPLKLSFILIIYTIINNIGVIAFGREVWFKYCEFFSVFFRLIGKMSFVEYRHGKFFLRPPFVGLLKEKADHFSLLVFTLFMLSSTAFDGLKETLPWTRFYWRYIDDAIRPIFETNSYDFFSTVGLALLLGVFLGLFLLLIYIAKRIAKSPHSLKELCLQFTFSLIPIAFVYNIAHYYVLIFSEGPNILRLFADPFGYGWNFFGIENYPAGIIVGANFVWHSQVALILIGHIIGVYLSHREAVNVFGSSRRAWWSQFPMLILMVAFTMIGLWILAQPITGGTL